MRPAGSSVGLLVMLCAALWPAASLPRPAIELRDAAAPRDPVIMRWRRLFGSDEVWLGRDIALLRMAAGGERARELLASRLLYQGRPWSGETRPAAWELHDSQVQKAILRELRYLPHPDLVPVYAAFLTGARGAPATASALINCRRLDPDRTAELLRRLVLPDDPDALPGASDPLVRGVCLRLAVDWAGAMPAVADAALAQALLRGDAAERRAAARLVTERRVGLRLALPALQRLLLPLIQGAGAPGPDDRDALVDLLAALDREALPPVTWRPLGSALCAVALAADRDIAVPAAGAIVRLGLPVPRTLLWSLRDRAAEVRDVSLRHSLLGLLAAIDFDQLRAEAGPASPWTALSLHRQRLLEAFPPEPTVAE